MPERFAARNAAQETGTLAFRFIHTSDWQIGKPFRNFEERVAGRLEGARLAVVDRIARLAHEHHARHVMVAGDIYDAQSVPLKTLMQPVHRMEQARDLTWWLIPGNHDPARAKGVWERLRAEGVPENIRILDTPDMVEMEPGVFLLPAPLTARSLSGDPTAWMDAAATPAGTLRIGLAHGSIKGFGSAQESSVSIVPDRAAKARLDYLALGDWHGSAKINARTWYSGTPEPDRFPDNAPGSVLAVTLDAGGAAPMVQALASNAFVWAKREFEIRGAGDLVGVGRELSALSEDSGNLVLRLRFVGGVRLGEIADVERWCSDFEARVQYLEADTSGLLPCADDDDLDLFSVSEELGDAARFLGNLAGENSDDRQPAAAAALVRLAVLTRRETAGGA